MIITISGVPGSGKSSIAKSLAKKLGYKSYLAGDVRGKFAIEHGMTIDQLNKQAEKNPESDFLVDEHLKEMAKSEDDFIVDARLGFFFIPQSIKIFVNCEPEKGAERVFNMIREDEKYKSMEQALKLTQERIKSDIRRYDNLYQINPYEERHYDLIIDSTEKSIEQCVGEIYRFIMFKINALNHEKGN